MTGARWLSADAGPELPTEVRYGELADAGGSPVLRVELDVEPPDALRSELPPDLSATVELTRVDGRISVPRDLPVALERAVAVLDARLILARGGDAERAALLGQDDAEIIVLALDWVEANRARDLADAVAELVDHEEERVALRAVECIGVVGGPQHVRALIRRPRIADVAHANRLYEALANLGGDHAIGFLEFAARNEDDPDLAGLAQRALARIHAITPASPRSAAGRGHRSAGEDT